MQSVTDLLTICGMQRLSLMRPPVGAPKGGTWAVGSSMLFFKHLVYTDPDGYTWDESGTCTTPGYQYDNDMSLS